LCDILFKLNTLIIMYYFTCWENGVLQLVSEQVGPSGQVVESCSVVCQLIYCHCVVLIVVCCVEN